MDYGGFSIFSGQVRLGFNNWNESLACGKPGEKPVINEHSLPTWRVSQLTTTQLNDQVTRRAEQLSLPV